MQHRDPRLRARWGRLSVITPMAHVLEYVLLSPVGLKGNLSITTGNVVVVVVVFFFFFRGLKQIEG